MQELSGLSIYVCLLQISFWSSVFYILKCVLFYQELIQNAEDAHASHVKFLHDKHSHGTAKLHHQTLAKFQVNFVFDVQPLNLFNFFSLLRSKQLVSLNQLTLNLFISAPSHDLFVVKSSI